MPPVQAAFPRTQRCREDRISARNARTPQVQTTEATVSTTNCSPGPRLGSLSRLCRLENARTPYPFVAHHSTNRSCSPGTRLHRAWNPNSSQQFPHGTRARITPGNLEYASVASGFRHYGKRRSANLVEMRHDDSASLQGSPAFACRLPASGFESESGPPLGSAVCAQWASKVPVFACTFVNS